MLETDAPSIGLDGVRPEDTEPRHVADIARAVVLEAVQQGRPVEIEHPEQPVPVVVVATAVRAALANLLENASDVTPDGESVKVEIGSGGDHGFVRITDRGPGLPPGLGDRIFERFVRGPDAGPTGTGLGLAFVAEVAAAHGGSVAAESRDGGGARFTLTVPIRKETG